MYRKLNPDKIFNTLDLLRNRIHERFPGSGIEQVCLELINVSRETRDRCDWIGKPYWGLRLGVGAVILALLLGLLETFLNLHASQNSLELGTFVQILEAGMSTVVLIGATVIFLLTVEVRIKRSRTLKSIHQLRAIAHVIDAHQLTKDPERLFNVDRLTASSPKPTMDRFELTRYLNYCSEMLALTGKVAALYSQNFGDEVILAAVNDVESLTTGLTRKIWQKLMILHLFDTDGAE